MRLGFGRGLVRGVVASLLALLVLGLLAGCGGSSGGSSGGGGSSGSGGGGSGGGTLTVYAASSLTDAFGELGKDFEKQNPGTKVRFSFASSSTLATQIQQGAPVDVFASADEAQMKKVQSKGLVSRAPQDFATNKEVILVPSNNPAGIKKFSDLSKPNIRLVLAQKDVPAAVYAGKILDKAAKDPQYGPGFEKAVLGNVVSREEDVRAAVNRVVSGDADATFGYKSDYTPDIRKKVKEVEIPNNLNITAHYPIAIVKGTKNEVLARKWVDLVTGDKGQQVLGKWGFGAANGS